MDKLKKNWFWVLVGLIALAAAVVYVMFVSGAVEKEAESEKKIDRSMKLMSSLSRKKPTPEWYEVLDGNLKRLDSEKELVMKDLMDSDSAIDAFFDLDQRDTTTMLVPPSSRYPEFKEMMQIKWSDLIARYGDEASMTCQVGVLAALEPSWLRNVQNPSSELQVSEAMKRYWIVEELLGVLKESGAVNVSSFKLGRNIERDQYKYNGQLFWGERSLEVSLSLEADLLSGLMRKIHESSFLFRVVGLTLKNVIDAPLGVTSNADFVSFRDPEMQEVTISVHHFDYVKEGEILSFGEGAAPGGAVNTNAGRRRRGR